MGIALAAAPTSPRLRGGGENSRARPAKGRARRQIAGRLRGRAGWGCASAFIAASCRVFCEAAHFLQHKVAIDAVVAHQLARRTILDDLSGSQNDDAIEVVDCR